MGDYLFQTKKLSESKRNSKMYLLMHGILYTAAIYLIFSDTIQPLVYYLVLVLHVLVDHIKIKGYLNKIIDSYTGVMMTDQAIHILVLIILIFGGYYGLL